MNAQSGKNSASDEAQAQHVGQRRTTTSPTSSTSPDSVFTYVQVDAKLIYFGTLKLLRRADAARLWWCL